LVVSGFQLNLQATELIPPLSQIKPDHPRVLLRSEPSPWAISVRELRDYPKDDSSAALLTQLRAQESAAAQAMVWLLTGEAAAAQRAIRIMQAYRHPGEVDTFHVYFTLTQFALAYDWLYGYGGLTPQVKAEIRKNLLPLAQRGLGFADDHVFHNYIWMSAGGVALWAMATARDDEEADWLFERIRERFNSRLFPAWKYLDGLPSEPMGYWALYVFTPGALALVAAQSAFEAGLVRKVREQEGDWLNRHFENLIHSTLTDQRYIPWGDLQSGPNGGVTRDMAGVIDALTWATKSPTGAYFSSWIASRNGLRRFRADTAIYYFLYTCRLKTAPAFPGLSFMAGDTNGGHFIARSGWEDDAVIVAFTATDHFGDHHHYDQGSFLIYKNGLLAVDPPVYQKVRGPQQPTEVHSTLLLGGQGQRPVRGQWFKTLEEFRNNLHGGRQLETGNILFWKEAGGWAAVAGEFAQAYSPGQIQSCVRQLLFLRPDTVVVVDQLTAQTNQVLPKVQWLLQVPREPVVENSGFRVSNGQGWLACHPLLPGGSVPTFQPTPVNTHRVSLSYGGDGSLVMAHLITLGDGLSPGGVDDAMARISPDAIEVRVSGNTFSFARQHPFAVTVADAD
jgi:hypothetical protein